MPLRSLKRQVCLYVLLLSLAACGSSRSADSYAGGATQQVNKVDKGIIVNVREVEIDGTHFLGATAGVAGGAVVGSQFGRTSGSAAAALGGAIIGGIVGAVLEEQATKRGAYEYIIQVAPDDLVSLTQSEVKPLKIGEKVLVIYGVQARIIPDTSVATAAGSLLTR